MFCLYKSPDVNNILLDLFYVMERNGTKSWAEPRKERFLKLRLCSLPLMKLSLHLQVIKKLDINIGFIIGLVVISNEIWLWD